MRGENGSDRGIRPGRRSVNRGLGRTILRERQPQLGGTSRESAPVRRRRALAGTAVVVVAIAALVNSFALTGASGTTSHPVAQAPHLTTTTQTVTSTTSGSRAAKHADNLPPPFRAQRPALDECGRDHDDGGRYHHLGGSRDDEDGAATTTSTAAATTTSTAVADDHLDGSRDDDDRGSATTTTAAAATTTTVATRASKAAPTTTSTTAPVTTRRRPHTTQRSSSR